MSIGLIERERAALVTARQEHASNQRSFSDHDGDGDGRTHIDSNRRTQPRLLNHTCILLGGDSFHLCDRLNTGAADEQCLNHTGRLRHLAQAQHGTPS